MKYLFSIHDHYENETKLYSVEAEDETEVESDDEEVENE